MGQSGEDIHRYFGGGRGVVGRVGGREGDGKRLVRALAQDGARGR